MAYSDALYQQTIEKIINGLGGLDNAVEHLRNTINNSLLSKIPLIGSGIEALWNKFIGLCKQFISKVQEWLRPAMVPTMMNDFSNKWLDVHTSAAGVSSTLELQVEQHGTDTWKGLAGGAYQTGVSHQAPTSNAIAGIASAIGTSCAVIRNFGYGFYIAVGATVVSVVLAVAAAETVVGALIGIAFAFVGLATAIGALYLGVDMQVRALRTQLGPNSSFPGNKWPQATVG